MRFLKESSFDVISLGEVVECIQKNRPFPKRSVVITFDDGFQNVYDEAYPILKEFGFRAEVFLVPEYCDRTNNWPGQPQGIPVLDLLSWDNIKEMSEYGLDFGAHTLSHPDLSKLPLRQAEREIIEAKSMIRHRVGKDVSFFAYPYGKQKKEIGNIIKDEFSCACSDKLGFVYLNSDLYFLPRIDMYYFSKNNLFKWMNTPFIFLYIKFRNTLRSFRAQF